MYESILYVISGDLASNRGRIIRLLMAGPVLRTIMQDSNTLRSRLEVASDVISGVAVD